MNYLRNHAPTTTPQSEPIPGSTQVANNAGGYAFEVDDFTKLRRFLVLGAEGGSYYVSERKMVGKNVAALERCLAVDPIKTIELIAEVSDRGLARDNDTALFCLAAATGWGNPSNVIDTETRRAAFRALPRVARTGTHLLHFVAFMEQFRGWGKLATEGIANWYESRSAGSLAYQMVKYRQRDGWSQRDVLRKAHPKAPSIRHSEIFEFVTQNATHSDVPVGDEPEESVRIIEGFNTAQLAETPAESADLIREYRLPREAVLTEHLPSPEVQAALLEGMPMTALIRNLGNMTRSGLLTGNSDATQTVVAKLGDSAVIRKARVHPLTIMVALRTYAAGRGDRGGNSWTPVSQVVDALNDAFYTAFEAVEPSGKRHLLALDVSHSMDYDNANGLRMKPKEAAAIMAMATARSESRYEVVAFSGREYAGEKLWSGGVGGPQSGRLRGYGDDRGFMALPLSPRQRLDDVTRMVNDREHPGLTDCALPMIYAKETEKEVDTFVVYTDNETWAGEIHPVQALRDYRKASGIDAKLVVCAMTASDFSIADPDDAGMLDVVGFDTSAPAAIAAFTRGEV